MRTAENMPQEVIESWKTLTAWGDHQFVTVNETRLAEMASANPELHVPDWQFPGMHPQNDWAFATQIEVADTINYMFLNRDIEKYGESWTMTDPITGKPLSGSNALLTSVYQRFGEAEDIHARDIEKLASKNEFDTFLPNIPMAETRKQKLADFALGLRRSYGGSVRQLIESSIDTDGNLRIFNRGAGMVERLLSDDFGDVFVDESSIDGLKFPFNKRANLTPILIYGRARSRTDAIVENRFPPVIDIDKSGTVPDYRLPQALRAMGAIAYSSELASQVDNYIPIEAGSQAEIEIRAATAYAATRLLELTNTIRAESGEDLYNMAHVDFWLWSEGRQLKKSGSLSLPHYTETTAY